MVPQPFVSLGTLPLVVGSVAGAINLERLIFVLSVFFNVSLARNYVVVVRLDSAFLRLENVHGRSVWFHRLFFKLP